MTTDETQKQTFKVISLDVWGHGPDEHEKYDCDGECEGYTVNDAHYTGREITVEAPRKVYNEGKPQAFAEYHADDSAIIKALVDAGELNDKALEPDAIKIDGEDDYTLFLEDTKTGHPLVHLERVK